MKAAEEVGMAVQNVGKVAETLDALRAVICRIRGRHPAQVWRLVLVMVAKNKRKVAKARVLVIKNQRWAQVRLM